MILHVLTMLEQRGLADQVNMRKVMQAVEEQNGSPLDITRGAPRPTAWSWTPPPQNFRPASLDPILNPPPWGCILNN